MRATGVIRRIDDLGRVVIPKEMRRMMRIREGDALELFIDNVEGCVCFKPYSPYTMTDLKNIYKILTGFISYLYPGDGDLSRTAIYDHYGDLVERGRREFPDDLHDVLRIHDGGYSFEVDGYRAHRISNSDMDCAGYIVVKEDVNEGVLKRMASMAHDYFGEPT